VQINSSIAKKTVINDAEISEVVIVIKVVIKENRLNGAILKTRAKIRRNHACGHDQLPELTLKEVPFLSLGEEP
jgi:hypothetical protein